MAVRSRLGVRLACGLLLVTTISASAQSSRDAFKVVAGRIGNNIGKTDQNSRGKIAKNILGDKAFARAQIANRTTGDKGASRAKMAESITGDRSYSRAKIASIADDKGVSRGRIANNIIGDRTFSRARISNVPGEKAASRARIAAGILGEANSAILRSKNIFGQRRSFACPRPNGEFPYPQDKNKFYRCLEGLALIQACGPRSLFDPQKKRCRLNKTNWFCTDSEERLSPLTKKQHTVEMCWTEAVRRRAHYLSVGLTGCRVGQSVDKMTDVPCSNTSRHVIDVHFYERDLVRINPDNRFWISGKEASGVLWGSVPNLANKPEELSACSNLCFTYGQDFARVDYFGCRCGRAIGAQVQIRHEDMSWAAGHLSSINPGFTVKLRAGNVTGWLCTAAPSDFVKFTGAQTMQEALEGCQRRRFLFLAAGEGGFYCGNNTANLERFSSSQCEMKLTKKHSFSVITINEIERQITRIEESIREYIFWWVSEKAPIVFWTTLTDVTSLEQCVLQCDRRFICVGADGCSCGSLRSDKSDVKVREWVKRQPNQEKSRGQGYLMLDKQGNVNVPEGWLCTTEPTQWVKTPDTLLQACLWTCRAGTFRFLAFGKSGCRCGHAGAGFRHLAMPHCQNPQAAAVQPYSVLSVDIWSNNFGNFTKKAGYQTHWVQQKPAGVQWQVAPGRTVLADCVTACEDKRGVKLVLMGVDGCECGLTTKGRYTPQLKWTASSKFGPARGFFLIQKDTVSAGYTAPVFRWVTKRNNTETKENEAKETPRWIRVNIAETSVRQARRKTNRTRQETESQSLFRTEGGGGSGLRQQRARSVTEVRANATSASRQVTRNKTGATDNKEVSKLSRTTQKVGKTSRVQNTLNETQKNYVSARDNSITVGSSKRRLVNIERENTAKQSTEAYKRHTITGEQTAGTIEHFISGERAQLVRVNTTNTKLLEKNVSANQTHLNASATVHDIRRLSLQQSRVTEKKGGKTFSVQVHIGGRCYIGAANKTAWLDLISEQQTPFKCLCYCVKMRKLFYAIYEQGKCFCAKETGNFGNNTGSITTTGKCPQLDARIVYNGIKHTQQLTRLCERPNTVGSSILRLSKTTLGAGERYIEFNNTENLRALKKQSSLRATHHMRTEEDTKTDILRERRKQGTTRETWNSRLSKGLFSRLFRLKLHVRREHNVTENVNLITKKDTRSVQHRRAPIFLSTSAKRNKQLSQLRIRPTKRRTTR